MFDDEDRSYFRHRAEVEVERARSAKAPEAAAAHHQLAQAYLSRISTQDAVEVEHG